VTKETVELFTRFKVLSEDELHSRYNVMLESYCKTINIEALMTISIGNTMILPAALEYQAKLASSIAQTKAAIQGLDLGPQEKMLLDVADRVNRLKLALEQLAAISHEHENDEGSSDLLSHARFYQDKVIPAMNAARACADELEGIVEDSLWPLPKFREMLYIY
jgi:glutamine synthetase